MKQYFSFALRSLFRVPVSVFFTLVYPLMMMVIIIDSYGNDSIGSGYLYIDKYFPTVVFLGLIPLALVSFPISLSTGIEDSSLKRMKFFHVAPSTIVISQICANVCMALLSVAVDLLTAVCFFKLKVPSLGYFCTFMLQTIYVLLVFMVIGVFLAVLFGSYRSVMAVGLAAMFFVFIVCGAFVPFEVLPEWVKTIGRCIPLQSYIADSFKIWSGKTAFNGQCIGLSTVYIVVFSMLTVGAYWWRRRIKR